MVEKSILWTTGATGDGTTEYTQSEVIRWLRQAWLADNTTEGPLKGYSGELEVTGASSPVAVAAGGAFVYGFPYWSTASENVVIPTPSAQTRIDRVVLRVSWAAQTVRIERLAGTEGAAAPALTQSDGTTWEISLAQCSITTGGTITVTDEREWARPNIGVDENMIDASVAGNALTGGDGTPLAVAVGAGLEISSDTVRISAAAAGDGLKGGAGSALDIEPANFAGAGLEDDGSDNLRIAAAAAGDGLQGGAGSALAVDVSDIAGAGLEDDGSENLRIAAAAAGDALGGGGGSALDVKVDNTTIVVNGSDQLEVSGIGAANIANRTRYLWVTVEALYNQTDTVWKDRESRGWPMDDNKTSIAYGSFCIPADWASGDVIVTPIFINKDGSTAQARIEQWVRYASTSEAWDTHSHDYAPANQGMSAGAYREGEAVEVTMNVVSAGDYVQVECQRNGADAADGINGTVIITGWRVSYTADM